MTDVRQYTGRMAHRIQDPESHQDWWCVFLPDKGAFSVISRSVDDPHHRQYVPGDKVFGGGYTIAETKPLAELVEGWSQ